MGGLLLKWAEHRKYGGFLCTGEHTLNRELAPFQPIHLIVHQKIQKYKVPFLFPEFHNVIVWTIKFVQYFYYWMQSRRKGVGIAEL